MLTMCAHTASGVPFQTNVIISGYQNYLKRHLVYAYGDHTFAGTNASVRTIATSAKWTYPRKDQAGGLIAYIGALMNEIKQDISDASLRTKIRALLESM